MIIVPVKDGENIERARQQFDKPSVKKRLKMEHAVYVQKLRDAEE